MVQLELYIREITRFLRTVTLKNVYFDEQMQNEWVRDQWRDKLPTNLRPYYRHLSGDYILKDLSVLRRALNDYHTPDDELCARYGVSIYVYINGVMYKNSEVYSHFDNLVIINSIDTKRPIPFTKKVLSSKEHRKTSALYRIPNKCYSTICKKYENEADIVKAIVYPIESIAAAVTAENFTILGCDLTLLKQNEQTSLYTCMLETLAVIKRRWDVKEFTYEDLYALSIQGKIWSILLLALFKQRILNIRTSAAHSYHVWEYLKSKGLDDFSDVLSQKQAIYLYRNFPYILRNRGSDHNLVLLAHKLLSDWNIVLYGKNLLQQSYNMPDTCKTSPVVDSVVINERVLNELKRIDKDSSNYVLKNKQAEDELKAFDLQDTDLKQLDVGVVESLDTTYRKEQEVGLEYQNEYLFDQSTSKQTKLFERTPHIYLPTKLIEISKEIESTLFPQIYSRFVTESLLYRASLGDLDYIISFIPDGALYPVNLTIKQAIAMVQYCALKETGMYDENMHAPKYAQLTFPYKTDYVPIKDNYNWYNLPKNTADALRIIPHKIRCVSEELPSYCSGVYELTNPIDSYTDWIWVNEHGCELKYNTDSEDAVWILQTMYDKFITPTYIPYYNWKHWEPVWTQDVYEYKTYFDVVDYEYMIDRYMPTAMDREFTTYEDVLDLIDTQARGYLQIYRELHGSDWSRQHSAVYQILTDRTYKGVVELDLLDGQTYTEFINDNIDLKTVIQQIESSAADMRSTEYAKFGNVILDNLLESIDSDYLLDNAGVSLNRFKKLKELFVSLCSYNIAFLEGNTGANNYSMTLPGYVTMDVITCFIGMDIKSYVPPVESVVGFQHYLRDTIDAFNIESYLGECIMNTPVEGETNARIEHKQHYHTCSSVLVDVKTSDIVVYYE